MGSGTNGTVELTVVQDELFSSMVKSFSPMVVDTVLIPIKKFIVGGISELLCNKETISEVKY
jgi:hypothetical protein